MKIKQTVVAVALAIVSTVSIASMVPVAVHAEPQNTSGQGVTTQGQCGGAKTSIISCNADAKSSNARDSAIWQVLLIILNILTAGVGILAVGGIAYGAILYSSAGDNASQTKKAIEIIQNVIIGIVAYGVMYMVLNYLIPGGIFT